MLPPFDATVSIVGVDRFTRCGVLLIIRPGLALKSNRLYFRFKQMWNIQQSKTVTETHPLTASGKLVSLRHVDNLCQCALPQRSRCTGRLFPPLSYSVKPLADICLRLVENTVVCALWMSFRNAASLSKSVFKLGLCYVAHELFWSGGGATGEERIEFWSD